MKKTDFDKVVENRLEACKALLIPKGEEYSRNGDRLWNFKKAALVLGVSPEQALLGMDVKHRVSVMDMVEDVAEGKLPLEKVLTEKINDSINYLLLLEALIRERFEDGRTGGIDAEILKGLHAAVDPGIKEYEPRGPWTDSDWHNKKPEERSKLLERYLPTQQVTSTRTQ